MYAFRQAELVGKRFLCVREKNSLRPNSRSSRVSNPLGYQWKVGVIRACSEKDFHHPELKVLVEYDNEDWTTREWLTIYDGSWKIFLVEKTMVWSQRPDPSNPRRPLLWPALTFSPLVDKHGLSDEDRPVPVEFVGDHERMFVRGDECRPYGQDDDGLQPALRNNPNVMEELRDWQRVQKSQSILLDGPFTLTGFRVQVYRQTCRQWYSAVITGHDLMSRELSCMDDTVLQTHRVDPRLTQVILLANETELDSLLRGELVRVLPMRQHRHSQVIITAPMTTQTTTNSLSSAAPTTWQLYAGLTHSTNSNNHLQALSSTQAVFSSPAVSTVTNRQISTCSPPNVHSTDTNKERKKSTETRNRSSASRRVTRSDSTGSPTSLSDTQQRTPQTIQSPLTTPSATSLSSSIRSVSHTSSQQSYKTSPPDAHTMSPKRSSSSSSLGSPSSSLQKMSPIKQPASPKTSPSVLHYGSPSKAGMSNMGSPFRSNPFCSSPDMSVASMASPLSGMSHIGMCSPGHMVYSRAQSPHPLYSHSMGHLNISPPQLYALQLQQQQKQMLSPEQQEFLAKLQHQHYQSLMNQYQMHHYQLQLMLQQQEIMKQMPLTLEQQHVLAERYNQLLYQYQCAQIFQQLATVTQDEQLSVYHGTDDRTRVLPERIQQQLREAQERQKQELQHLMPRLEPEQLQTFFTCLQQRSMTSDQMKELYTLLIQQQEAQKRQPQQDERQRSTIQDILRQNQEDVKKILQLQQSPSRSRDLENKDETRQEASSSSAQPESPSSSASSFTVHYMPTPCDSGDSSDSNGKDKPEKDASVGKSTSETSKPEAKPSVDEIELKSTTTDEERSSSPHAILEKLLQHHLEAVKLESKQQASAKARRTRASSTEKRTKRQRKSAELSSAKIQDDENNSAEKDNQNFREAAVTRNSFTTDPLPCPLTGDVSRETTNTSVNHTFSLNDNDSVLSEQKLPKNLGFVDSHLSEAEKQNKTAHEQVNTSLRPEQRYPLEREDTSLMTSGRVATGDVVKEAPRENIRLKDSTKTRKERTPVMDKQNKVADISKDNAQVTKNEKVTSLNRKLSEKASANSTAAEQAQPSELVSLLKKKSSRLAEEVRTEGSNSVASKNVTANEPEGSVLEETSSISLQNQGAKTQNNLSAKDVTVEKPQSQFFGHTPPIFPGKETCSGSENVSSKSSVQDRPTESLIEKRSEQEEDKRTANVLPTVTEKGWLELTTLRGKRKTSGKLTVMELSKPTPLSLTRKSFHDAAKAAADLSPDNLSRKSQDNQSAADVSQDNQFGQSEGNQSVQLQDKTSDAMEVDNFPASQKPPAIPDARQLTKNCFSVFSSNSSDHNGDLFAEKELKTYSRRITPNKRKSISTSKENITERSTVISKVLKMDNSESLDVDGSKIEAHENGNKMDNQVLDSDLSKDSQPEQKSIKRQQNSRTKGKISRKKSTSENKIPAKRAKSGDSNCDNTEAIQNNSQMELDDEASKLVDSVSFVADQAIEDVTINHSPTLKDVPGEQFDFVKLNDEVLNDKSKEKIREMTSIRKKIKEKEKKRKKKENKNELPASATVVKKELVDGESLETVVDSVLDEQIAVIYNGEEHQENGAVNSSEIKEEVVVKEEEKTEVVEKPKPGRGRKKKEAETKEVEKGRKRRGKKQNENNGDKLSPNSEQFFLQDKVCSKFSDLPMCRDCRDINGEKTGLEFCRFNMFRRLKKRKNGNVLIAGFQLPEHAAPEDFYPWVAQDQADMMDKSTSLYVLSHIGDQFCSVMQEERKAITQAGENVKVVYKRAVQGVREMCDVCATTIFNMHWVCHRCGFGVCLDCYNLRVKEREEQPGHAGKRVFEFKWCMCCPGICHQPKNLSVAQIIPKSVLSDLGDELHRARDAWKIGKTCPCKTFVNDEDKESGAKITEISYDALDKTDNKEEEKELQNSCKEVAREVTVKLEPGSAAAASESAKSDQDKSDQARSDELKSDSGSSDLGKSEPAKSDSVTSAPLNQNLLAVDSESGEGVDDVNLICDESMGIDSPASHEQLWLTEEKRRNHFSKKAGFGLVEAKPRQNNEISSGLSLLMDYSSSAEGSPCESPAKSDNQTRIGAFDFPFVSGLDLLALACEKNGGFSLYENVTQDDQKHNNEAECSKPEPQDEKKEEVIRNGSVLVATPSECTSAESSDEVRQATPIVPDRAGLDPPMDAPHSWLCNGRLLRLLDPRAPGNVKAFEKRWKRGEPVLVSHVDKYMNLDLWTPEAFGNEFGSEIADVVNCRNGVVVERFKVGDFWLGFESIKDRPLDSNGEPMLLKLKDWPPKDDFSEKLPTRFEDLMNNAPLPEYTRRDGSRNLVSRLPDFFVTPDLGPKMYNAYGSAACPKEGTTNLHLDMSDAVNVMVYVGVPRDEGAGEKEREDAIKAVDEACDESQQLRVRQETARIGALWHIYAAEDADKIRECLREVAKERRSKHPSHHDPIHDQCFYLDHDIRQRLKKDYGVEGWAICQCLGDAVFIPAGAPHQVRNLYSCVKVAEDFVSPERIDHCVQMTQEFRHLSDKHTNHEDKLQVKNIIYHAVKDALKSLQHYEKELSSTEEQRGKECDRVG